MSRILLLTGIGGFIGGISRYLTAVYITKFFPSSFPVGTLAVNFIGCLLIGIFHGLAQKYSWLTLEWQLFLTTGLCGGYTTFSAFAYENIVLLQEGRFLIFTLYSLGSFALGLLAVLGGLSITKL